MRAYFWLAILLAACAAQSARAEGTEEQRAHCSDDAFKFCDDYVPDALAVEKCMRAHMSQLSPACRAEFGGGPAKRKKRRGG